MGQVFVLSRDTVPLRQCLYPYTMYSTVHNFLLKYYYLQDSNVYSKKACLPHLLKRKIAKYLGLSFDSKLKFK